mgnify:CR=1 FL=1
MRRINLFSALVVLVTCGYFLSGAEPARKSPTVEETREGEMTILRVKSAEGVERAVYRLNLTKRHEPATARSDRIARAVRPSRVVAGRHRSVERQPEASERLPR